MKSHKIFEIRNFKQIIRATDVIVVMFILANTVLVRAADGDVDSSFQGSALRIGTVFTTAVQSDGKILVGGNFYAVNGVPCRALARLNTDGTLDTMFQPNVQGIVYSISVQPDGKILVGGAVTLNLPTRQRLNFFRLNANGTSDDSFNAGGGVTGGTVYAIAQQSDGKILIGGNFNGSNGFFQSGIFRINADGTTDTSFLASVFGATSGEGIRGLALQTDGKVVIAGDFNSVNSTTRIGIARLNSTGTVDASFNGSITSANRSVLGLTLQPDDKIIICGSFSQINGIAKGKIARFNTDGSLDTSFVANIPTALYNARTVRLQEDGKIFVGGFFAQINGTSKSNIARLLPNGTLDTNFNAGTLGTVCDITPGDNPLIVGEFTELNNADSFGISRTDSLGNRDNSFNPGIGTVGIVRKLVPQSDGKLVVGGEFTHFVNSSRSNVARLNNDGTLDASFDPGTGFEADSRVNDVAVLSSSKIAVAGNFNSYNGATQRMLVVLNADGTRDTTFNPNFTQPGEIRKVVPYPGGKILILGAFRFGSDAQGTNFALLNVDGTHDTSFAPTFTPSTGAVNTMAVQPDGKIVVAGGFTAVNGISKSYIARLNADGGLDNTLTLNLTNYNQIPINEIYIQPDGKILISGNFQRSDTQFFVSVGLLRLNPNGGRDLLFNAPPGRNIDGLTFTVQADGRIFVVMRYTFQIAYFNTVTKTFITRLRSNGTLDYAFKFNFRGIDPNSAQSVHTMAVFPDNKLIIGGNFPAYTNTPRISLARLENFMQPNAVFDFEGDGRTDISIFRPSVGEWWINRSSSGQTVAAQFGISTDKPVSADFTGDGKTDIAFWRPSSGEWFILRSEDSSYFSFPFGTTGDTPQIGDFDADGKADPTIFRPSNSTWYILKSGGGGTIITTFGTTGDIPVSADYDGDDKTDIAIYRPSNGQWWLYRSSLGIIAATFGTPTDKLVPGDYSGDCRADVAFWRPSTGEWFILRSEDGSYFSFPFGTNGDVPVPGDYDSDGIFDVAVYRPMDSVWYIDRSSSGTLITRFGTPSDQPIPGTFVP